MSRKIVYGLQQGWISNFCPLYHQFEGRSIYLWLKRIHTKLPKIGSDSNFKSDNDHTMWWSSYCPHSEALKLWTVLQEQRLLGTDNVGDAPLSAMCKSTLFCTPGTPEPQTQRPVPFMPPSLRWLPHLAPHRHPAVQLFGEGKPLTWAHRMVCFDFPLAHDLPFVFSIKWHWGGHSVLPQRLNRGFPHLEFTSTRRWWLPALREHLYVQSKVAALTALRVYMAPQGGRGAFLWKQLMPNEWIKHTFRA